MTLAILLVLSAIVHAVGLLVFCLRAANMPGTTSLAYWWEVCWIACSFWSLEHALHQLSALS